MALIAIGGATPSVTLEMKRASITRSLISARSGCSFFYGATSTQGNRGSQSAVVNIYREDNPTLIKSNCSVSKRTFATKKSEGKVKFTPSSAGGNKKKKGKRDENQTETDAIYKFLHALEDAKRFKLQFTEEELAENSRIAREYQRQQSILHNQMQKDLSDKIWLQQEAMNALPEELRAAAEEIDDTPPPEDRPWPSWDTPPIKDFNPQDYLEKSNGPEQEEEI